MVKLVLIRHGQSEWNLENKFTGWTDVELSPNGEKEATEAGKLLKEKGYSFDMAFSSVLKRANHTMDRVLKELGEEGIETIANDAQKSHRIYNLNGQQLNAATGICIQDGKLIFVK